MSFSSNCSTLAVNCITCLRTASALCAAAFSFDNRQWSFHKMGGAADLAAGKCRHTCYEFHLCAGSSVVWSEKRCLHFEWVLEAFAVRFFLRRCSLLVSLLWKHLSRYARVAVLHGEVKSVGVSVTCAMTFSRSWLSHYWRKLEILYQAVIQRVFSLTWLLIQK